MVTANKQKYWYKKAHRVHIEALRNHKIWPEAVNMRQMIAGNQAKLQARPEGDNKVGLVWNKNEISE